MDDKILDAMESGYDNYKDIHIKKIEALNIKTFRSLKDKTLDLGNVITIISGKRNYEIYYFRINSTSIFIA